MSIQGPTDYQHPWPNYQLNDLHQAMDYNAAGQPIIRVSTGSSGYGNTVINGNTGSDAFGRTRISEPFTLFDSQNRYINGDQFASKTNGTASVNYVANESSFNLVIGSTSGDYIYRQGRTVQLYQPGKSLLILNTFSMSTLQSNLRQRVGYFTTGNGIYFEADGDDLYMVIRSSVSGSPVNTRIAQTDWNQDPMNGSGPSGITLDPTKTQIFWCDIEWLGVGSVRVGFVINGVFYICHVFNHANQETAVYMTTASLNCRYEIENTGTTVGTPTMKQICSTVISEGGYTPTPTVQYVRSSLPAQTLGPDDTIEPLATIRLNPAYPDAVVLPAAVDFLTTSVVYGEILLIKDGTLTGASYANVANSVIQTDVAANAISGGTIVYSKLFASREAINLDPDVQRRLQLDRDADGNPSILTLCVQTTSNNPGAIWSFGWAELSS